MMQRYRVSYGISTTCLKCYYQKEFGVTKDEESASDIAMAAQTISEFREIDDEVNAMSMVFYQVMYQSCK